MTSTRRRLLRLGSALLTLAAAGVCATAQGADARPSVVLETNRGNITIELYPDQAPLTVANFLELAETGFYEGIVFHRVIAGFMIQAGAYDANMTYREAPRMVVNESDNALKNFRGFVAMARTNDPNSAGSQFFVNVNNNNQLDAAPGRAGYTVFGRVTEGMDVVAAIELSETGVRAGMRDCVEAAR